MSYPSWRTLGAATALLAVFAGNAFANPSLQSADPVDPAAASSPFEYKSVFKSYQKANEEETSPSKAWRAANEEVARIGGHAGYMKNESPASQALPASAAEDHGSHHGMHH